MRNNPAFLPVSPETLQTIEGFRSGGRVVDAGGTIVEEHRKGSHVFTIYAGWAFRYKTLSDGRRQILSFLLPGDFVGLQDEFADGRTHGVEAVTGVALCAFPRDRLWTLFNAQPKLGYDITWLAARDEQRVDDNLVTAGRRNAQERVAMLLMHLYRRAERVGMVSEGWVEFPFTQQHLADALGLSLVHTNKTMRRLQRLGLYKLDAGWLRILEPRALEALGDYFERPIQPSPLI
ncbi:MAG: Crp/Fnr family transcriptional regulator [Gammaproteobacteria bacterium]|nr:Crp/Fnr family transcriptional regulator [Gammaproteobacteria bacterium]MBU1443236.1 Crp/Fnr family transcriptional regulator [Gammaproteobacteria bacterium]MBU2288075.1 Crp/Fnr family transcriptional regulator [Gammaproteobacteria bacterium]MBU2408051.1 Crp/Fnr family transcriptional regulator [Gammaproteobacteria bacterium]